MEIFDPKKHWFVLIYARDEYYLKEMYAHLDLNYHSARNADINTYTLAIKFIINKGGFVVRIGYKVKDKLKVVHPKILDYSSKFRSDFMDIFLVSQCKFMIGGMGGMNDICEIFDIPRLSVNAELGGIAPFGKKSLYIPKIALDYNTNEIVKFSELLNKGKNMISPFQRSDRINELGYKLVNNTEEEILDAVKEMYKLVNNDFLYSQEDLTMQNRYRELFPPDHFRINIKTHICTSFLKRHHKLLN